MRVLFLTQVLPYPLDAGPKVRAYYTLRHLARRGHAVTLLSFVRDSDTEAALDHLREYCTQVLAVPLRRTVLGEALGGIRSLATREPFLITRDHFPAMLRAAQAAADGVDVIHADQLWMAPYALAAARAHGGRPRLVLDQHNAVFLIPQRMADSARNLPLRLAYQRETALMRAFECRVCQLFDQVVTVTEQDRDTLLGLYPTGAAPGPWPAIPICIEPPDDCPLRVEPCPDELLFVGGMHWPPNADGVQWFAREVLPLARQAAPHLRFTAVGKAPPAVAALGSDYIQLPGYVDDLGPYWAGRPTFVVPLRAGGGMRVKIIEAWGQGLPVVSTTIGAEGLACRPGENILLADTPGDFADAILQLQQDPQLAARVGQGGRETVQQHYDWRRTYSAWDQVYQPARAATT